MELLEEALDAGTFATDPALGIAKQVVHQGINSLTDKQRLVFDHQIWTALGKMQRVRDQQRDMER